MSHRVWGSPSEFVEEMTFSQRGESWARMLASISLDLTLYLSKIA